MSVYVGDLPFGLYAICAKGGRNDFNLCYKATNKLPNKLTFARIKMTK